MQLKNISIRNYKSLRSVEFSHGGLSTLIGANASGKSNFADAIDFLSLIYRHGLETAIAMKGGYENIALRKQRRSKAPIEFDVQAEFSSRDVRWLLHGRKPISDSKRDTLSFQHSFSFRAVGSGIRAEFKVEYETIKISSAANEEDLFSEKATDELELVRTQDGGVELLSSPDSQFASTVLRRLELLRQPADRFSPAPQELLIKTPIVSNMLFNTITDTLGRMSVYRFSTGASRQPGVPTPNPNLEESGANLPALVDWLQRKHKSLWKEVLEAMQEIVPSISNISVEYLHTKTLGLFFHEDGFGRPWAAEDVSDGTIRTLAILVALYDPRSSLLVIEEPENSVHPWIVSVLIKRFRDISKNKPVIITTHSPVVIDLLYPTEAWIVFKRGNETNLETLISFDPGLQESWEAGKFKLSEYLQAGLVPEATPGPNQ